MPRSSILLVAALGLIVGCRDGPANTVAPLVDETSPATLDLTAAHEILANPLASELLQDVSDPSVGQTFGHLVEALATPTTQSQLAPIQWTFSQVLADLTSQEGDGNDAIPRAVLGLLVEEARVVLDDAAREKGI